MKRSERQAWLAREVLENVMRLQRPFTAREMVVFCGGAPREKVWWGPVTHARIKTLLQRLMERGIVRAVSARSGEAIVYERVEWWKKSKPRTSAGRPMPRGVKA